MKSFVLIFGLLCVTFCSKSQEKGVIQTHPETSSKVTEPTTETSIETIGETESFLFGADLSYVNEMEDCGATYKNYNGELVDVFEFFGESGANIVRVRLWHNPQWTSYSNFEDVKKTIKRAKNNGMKVLLDFHYSDTWADVRHQQIPVAWEDQLRNTTALGKLLYDYTYSTIDELGDEGLLPDIVQIGNEINAMILQKGKVKWPIDWSRNASLLNKGINAVRDISRDLEKRIGVMLHIAQPENALWWFEEATNNGVTDFDWIGISYYPIWSEYNLSNVSRAFANLISTYKKQLMIVETAYPFTLKDLDIANNILGEDALLPGYPPTEQGQYDYLKRLKEIIESSRGAGLIYWEPAWVSTRCNTLWGKGSHWDNATLFNHKSMPTKGMRLYSSNK